MKNLRLTMIRKSIKNIPQFDLPEGYFTKSFREGDQHKWAEIETAIGEFSYIDEALQRFNQEFGPFIKEFEQRSLFLVNHNGEYIGTGTAWYNNTFKGGHYGRVHWIGIRPEYQGKNLAKPLVSAVINVLKQHHSKFYLTTQTTSYKAVKIYLDFDFKPHIESDRDREGWKMLSEKLNILF